MSNRNLIRRLDGFRIVLGLSIAFWVAVAGIIVLIAEVVK